MKELIDIRAAIRHKCDEYMRRWAKWNAKDPELYRERGDMNRYIISLDKRGWSVPFVLSDYPRAKAALYHQIRYHQEFRADCLSRGQPDDLKGSLMLAALTLTYERTEETLQAVSEYFETPYGRASQSGLTPHLERSVALAFAGRTHYLPAILRKIEWMWRERSEEFGTDAEIIPPALSVIEAEHLFWSKNVEHLAPLADTLLDTINAMPTRYFGGKDYGVPLYRPKDVYVSFGWFLKFLFPPARDVEKSERAAAMMVYCALDDAVDTGYLLAIKYYEIIAQMIVGKDKELESFYEHFPILSKFLQSVADQYRR
ncbi:hypothetical protein JW916_03845 [Candidatus Sumerlaeota bacterium]|nr:hypothetical protein [Candidatus Sumerlaeota bacterium]